MRIFNIPPNYSQYKNNFMMWPVFKCVERFYCCLLLLKSIIFSEILLLVLILTVLKNSSYSKDVLFFLLFHPMVNLLRVIVGNISQSYFLTETNVLQTSFSFHPRLLLVVFTTEKMVYYSTQWQKFSLFLIKIFPY